MESPEKEESTGNGELGTAEGGEAPAPAAAADAPAAVGGDEQPEEETEQEQLPAPAGQAGGEEPAAAAAAEEEVRSRVGEGRLVGLVTEWKGHMGWVEPLPKVQHAEAKKHGGLIYLARKDVVVAAAAAAATEAVAAEAGGKGEEAALLGVKPGKIVDFLCYADGKGLGAEECRPRAVLRLALTHGLAKATFKEAAPQWSENLPESGYYPAFEEEHGVLLRKYDWRLPFVVVELWAPVDGLAGAALLLGRREEKAEGGEGGAPPPECSLRLLVREADLPKVEAAPGLAGCRVSDQNVMSRPAPCRSLTVEGPEAHCREVLTAFLHAMS